MRILALKSNRLSIRARLFLLLCIAATSAIIISVVNAGKYARLIRHHERTLLRNAADHVSDTYLSRWTAVNADLSVVAKLPLKHSTGKCPAILRRLKSISRGIDNAGIIGVRGNIICSAGASRTSTGSRLTTDPALIQAAFKRPKSTVTGVVREPASGRPSLLFLHRLQDPKDKSDALVYATSGLNSLKGLITDDSNPHRFAALLDSDGHVIAMYPPRTLNVTDQQQMADHKALESRAWPTIQTDHDNEPHDVDLGDVIVGYSMIGDDLGYAVTATDTADLYRPAKILFWRNLLIAVVFFIITLVLAWRFLVESLIGRTRSLRLAAAALTAGNLDARVDFEGGDEISSVGQSFNKMAAALSLRTREAERSADELEHTNRILRAQAAVSRISAIGNETADVLQAICQIIVEDVRLAAAWVAQIKGSAQSVDIIASQGLDLMVSDCQPPSVGDSADSPSEIHKIILTTIDRQRPTWTGIESNNRNDEGNRDRLTVVAFPLQDRNQVHYVLILFVPDQSRFSTKYRSLLHDLSHDVFNKIRATLAESAVTYLQSHDPVTGLLTRESLVRQLDESLPHLIAGKDGISVAVLAIDIVNFQKIIDATGQNIGDELNRLLSDRLLAMTTIPNLLVAHTALDFFCALRPITNADEALRKANLIAQELSRPLVVAGGETLYPQCQIGIALFPRDATQAATLIDQARQAVKTTSSADQVAFFSHTVDRRIREDRRLEQALHDALQNDRLALHYQPVIEIDTKKIVGFEALARWPSGPDGQSVPPWRFIPIAERSGIIGALGDWTLRTAMMQMADWTSSGHSELRLSVNVSASQFGDPEFINRIASALDEFGKVLSAYHVAFEITESLLLNDSPQTRTLLQHLNELGFLLYLDDFGTGYSSLSYLHTLPFHTLKIDQKFMKTIATEKRTHAIVRAIMACADALELNVIAEGIETAEQLKMVRLLGCQYVQGYLTGRPLPSDEATALLDRPLT